MDITALMAALQPKGTARGGALFDTLSDIEKSAVMQTTGGSMRRMEGAPEEMLKLRRKMRPDQYREMMENQLLINEAPLSQLIEALGIRRGGSEGALDFNNRFTTPK